MQFVKENIGDIEKLEQLGEIIERTADETGIDDLGDQIEKGLREAGIKGSIHLNSRGKKSAKVKVDQVSEEDSERMRKRIRGLIKLHKNIPIDKLAQALDKSEDYAENLIYELAAEGVEGELDEGVFKFKGDIDEVLSILFSSIHNIINDNTKTSSNVITCNFAELSCSRTIKLECNFNSIVFTISYFGINNMFTG